MIVQILRQHPMLRNTETTLILRERSQMTSSKIRGFQTPSPLHHLPSSLPSHLLPNPPPFPKMILGKIFYGKIKKLKNQDLAMNIIQNKNRSTSCWLNVLDIK